MTTVIGCGCRILLQRRSESILPTDRHNIVVELPQRIRRGPLRPLKRHDSRGTFGELISQFRPSLMRDILPPHVRISNNVAREALPRMNICQGECES